MCKIAGCDNSEIHGNGMCTTHYMKDYRETHRAELRQKGNEYYKKNQEACLRRSKEYKQTPKSKAYQKKFREENRERLRQVQTEWRAAHMERRKEICLKYYLANKESILARTRIWQNKNKEHLKKQHADYYSKHRDQIRSYCAQWSKLNPDKRNSRCNKWKKNHMAKVYVWNSRRRANRLHAAPAWANTFFIEEIYDLARRRTVALGFRWHVDHIVPLQNKLVCGLHCEANLQVIPATDNLTKGNRYWPDMPENMR